MGKEIQVFKGEFGQIRTVLVDGEPWFVAKDICDSLGYSKPRNAVAQHVDSDDALKQGVIDSLGREQETTLVNESGMYALIFGSKLETAKKFKKWVTSDVLPSIRKTGFYNKPLTDREMMRLQLEMVDEVSERVTKLENNMTIDYSQQLTLGNLVSEKVIKVLGGKDSNAYKEVGKKVFAECNRDLKNYFHVNSRNNIAVVDFDKARKFIINWCPSYTTHLMIEDANNQVEMSI